MGCNALPLESQGTVSRAAQAPFTDILPLRPSAAPAWRLLQVLAAFLPALCCRGICNWINKELLNPIAASAITPQQAPFTRAEKRELVTIGTVGEDLSSAL